MVETRLGYHPIKAVDRRTGNGHPFRGPVGSAAHAIERRRPCLAAIFSTNINRAFTKPQHRAVILQYNYVRIVEGPRGSEEVERAGNPPKRTGSMKTGEAEVRNREERRWRLGGKRR
jgi:hypothetical protein